MPDDYRPDLQPDVETSPVLTAEAAVAPKRRAPLVRVGYVLGGIFGALVLLIVLFLLLFDWNWLRGPIGRFASAQMHREVRIDGNLRVHLLTWTPRIRVERLFIGQPDWAKPARAKPFASVDAVTFDVKLAPLFAGRIESPFLEIRHPELVLYQDAKGLANWDFSDPKAKTTGKPFKIPPIQQLVIADGHIDAQSLQRKAKLTATITSSERMQGGPAETFRLAGLGSLNGNAFKLDLRGGPLIHVRRDRPYPFDADVRAGATHITAHGSVTKPFDMGQVETAFTVTGKDLDDLHDLTGVALPNSPPYRISGRLTRDDKLYDIKGLSGRIGTSDVGGHLSVDTTRKRPYLKAELTSQRLDFADLAAVFGAPGVSKAATPEQKAAVKTVTAGGARLLPDATLKVDSIRSLDADVTAKAFSVQASPNLPIRGLSFVLKLKDGLLKIDPLTLTLPQGRVTGGASLDARGAQPITEVDFRLSDVQLETYIPAVGGSRPIDGTLAARIKLRGAGNSVHAAAASSNGQVTALIPRGHIRQAFAELLGVDAAKGLFLLLNKDKHETELRCAVADFSVKDGVMTAERITIDTTVVVVNGQGAIDLKDESLNLKFVGKPTRFRLIRLNAPITVGGRLNNPKFGVQAGGAITQAGVGLALAAAVNPLLVIVPFLAAGGQKNADCGELTSVARTSDAPVAASQTKKARTPTPPVTR